MISPMSTMIYFTILTTGYFGLKYFMAEKAGSKNKGIGTALTVVYLVIMILLQLATNLSNAKEKCGGTPQIVAAFNYTIIPNLFIFGGLMMMMMFFPGWKAPFSNTIGYLCTMAMSIKEVFINILKPDSNNKLLKLVYRDPSMMINEMTPENFQLFLSKMGGENSILKPGLKDNDFDDLYDLVVMKDRIAEYLWYMLTGALVIQNSHSYIMSIKCKRSASELESKLGNLMNNPKKKKKPQTWALGY